MTLVMIHTQANENQTPVGLKDEYKQTDTTDCISFPSNAVSNNHLR